MKDGLHDLSSGVHLFYSRFQLRKKGTPPPEDKEKAEKLKLEGNDLMRSENFEQAVEKYTR